MNTPFFMYKTIRGRKKRKEMCVRLISSVSMYYALWTLFCAIKCAVKPYIILRNMAFCDAKGGIRECERWRFWGRKATFRSEKACLLMSKTSFSAHPECVCRALAAPVWTFWTTFPGWQKDRCSALSAYNLTVSAPHAVVPCHSSMLPAYGSRCCD